MLKRTMDYGLRYICYPSVLEGYSYPSWINHLEDHSSTSGCAFLLEGGVISWTYKKKTCIKKSKLKYEFVELSVTCK